MSSSASPTLLAAGSGNASNSVRAPSPHELHRMQQAVQQAQQQQQGMSAHAQQGNLLGTQLQAPPSSSPAPPSPSPASPGPSSSHASAAVSPAMTSANMPTGHNSASNAASPADVAAAASSPEGLQVNVGGSGNSHSGSGSTGHTLPSHSSLDDSAILFVGDLARSVREEDLANLFSPFGTLTSIDLKRDKNSAAPLGYAFVQFATRAEAHAAKTSLGGLNSTEFHGRKLRIGWAQKNTTLFVGDLDGSITTAMLIAAFEPFGTIVEEETFVKQPQGKYGFVRFANREDAEAAKVAMNHKMLGSRPIRIGWGDSNFEKHCVHVQFDPSSVSVLTGGSVQSVFDEDFFQRTFHPFAEQEGTVIVSISLPRQTTNKKLKGYAFIHYTEDEAGERAALRALLTLTNQLPASAQAAEKAEAASVNNLSPSLQIQHLQPSFGSQAASDLSSPPTSNNAQQHLLNGIPVKYSFGKRQIFTRHRRPPTNQSNSGGAGGGNHHSQGGHHSHHGHHHHGGHGHGHGHHHGHGPHGNNNHGGNGLNASALGALGGLLGGQGSPHHGAGGHHPGAPGLQHNLHGMAALMMSLSATGALGGGVGAHGNGYGGGRGNRGYGGRHSQQSFNYQQQHQQQSAAAAALAAAAAAAQQVGLPGLGGQQALYSNPAFLPYLHLHSPTGSPTGGPQPHSPQGHGPPPPHGSPLGAGPGANRYATNVHQQSPTGAQGNSFLNLQGGSPHGGATGGNGDSSNAAAQASAAAAAASWMLQNLTAQQYGAHQQISPMSVQQAYQQLQQQHSQAASPSLSAGGLHSSPASQFYGLDPSPSSPLPSPLDGLSGSTGSLSGDGSSPTHLTTAATAFFNAQNQSFFPNHGGGQQPPQHGQAQLHSPQQQPQQPAHQGGSFNHLSLNLAQHGNASASSQPHALSPQGALAHSNASMAQLLSEMNSLALNSQTGSQQSQQQQQQQQSGSASTSSPPGVPPVLIASGHSSTATSPSNATNMQQFYSQQM